MKTAIIGRGNVANHLDKAFVGKCGVVMVNPHTLGELPCDADVILISVKDDAIAEVARHLESMLPEGSNAIVAHTSGSKSMDVLGFMRHPVGVFYPLQTFSKDVPLDYAEIPFFIEGSNPDVATALKELAGLVSGHVHEADSSVRRTLHIASVLACNFTNHLWALADDVLRRNGLDFSMLHPLVKETCRKAMENNPGDVQTGPARRGDSGIVSAHLEALADMPGIHDIYEILSNSITERYHERNQL